MRHYLSNLWMNIYGKKQIVCQVNKFGNISLFILIRFKIDRIVCDRPNVAVNLLNLTLSSGSYPFHKY
jgi:hypothetical protein